MIKRIYSILLMLVVTWVAAMAQNSTCSPYSTYGLGELSDHTPNAYRAMGGVGIGMRSNKAINPMQPASYTACDSMTFMFDLAAGVSWSRYKDASGQRNRANGNLEYISLQFPIWKQHIAMAAGLLPYASKGYEVLKTNQVDDKYHYRQSFGGYGTISEVYAGLSFNIYDWLAVGGNFYYMFGNMYNERSLSFTEGLIGVTEEDYLKVNNVWWKVGAQLFHTFGDHSFVVGGTFQYKTPLKSDYYVYETISEWYADSIMNNVFDIPTGYGVGASYTWANRLTVAFDYQKQLWSTCQYINTKQYYRDYQRYSLGVEYRHNPMGRDYVDRVCWRLGGHLVQSYLPQIKGPEWSISAGVGLPLRTVGTTINATVEYLRRGAANDLQENNLKLTINAAIAENWFFKRKI